MERTALIVVDWQNDYFEGGKMPLNGAEAAARQAHRLQAGFRAAGLPVFNVRHETLREPAPFFAPGTEGAEIHPLLAPAEGEAVITKNFPNSFRGTDLLERLQAQGVETLVIAGAMTHMCIDATTRAAADLGFRCRLAQDACATRDLEFGGVAVPAAQVHAAFLAGLSGIYADIRPTEELLPAA